MSVVFPVQNDPSLMKGSHVDDITIRHIEQTSAESYDVWNNTKYTIWKLFKQKAFKPVYVL